MFSIIKQKPVFFNQMRIKPKLICFGVESFSECAPATFFHAWYWYHVFSLQYEF